MAWVRISSPVTVAGQRWISTIFPVPAIGRPTRTFFYDCSSIVSTGAAGVKGADGPSGPHCPKQVPRAASSAGYFPEETARNDRQASSARREPQPRGYPFGRRNVREWRNARLWTVRQEVRETM